MDGPIKIGCSASPDRRRSSLETWSPFPLEIIAVIEGGEKLERRFHAKFTGQHKSREWFRISTELLVTIDAINAGTFDIETLPAPRRLHHGHRTGPMKGKKWSPERKASAAVGREVRKAEKISGLLRPLFGPVVTTADFIADPHKYGVTFDEWIRQRDAQWAKWGFKPVPAEPKTQAAA